MSKITLMVCPHDTATGPEGWYRLAQYLHQHVAVEVHFELALDFEDFHQQIEKADLVYVNPTDLVPLIDTRGFVPLVRPLDEYDEMMFVANLDIANPDLASLEGQAIATVHHLLPTNIALYLLHHQSITPATLIHHESWLSVIRSVWQNEVGYGIIYKDTYDELSEQGKAMTHAFFTSDEKMAFHSMAISPAIQQYQSQIVDVLLAMDHDATGQDVLAGMPRIDKWLPVTADELAAMRHLIETHVWEG